MEESATSQARDFLRLGKVNEARSIVEAEIKRISDDSASEVWPMRFLRAQILALRGQSEEALQFLESLSPPHGNDAHTTAELKRCRGAYAGYLGRYEIACRLFDEAEVIAREANLFELLGDVYLSRAFIVFRQKDYIASDVLFRLALELSEKVGSSYLRGNGLWGVGKNLMIQEHYAEGIPWLEQSLAIFEEAGSRLEIAMVWSELAVCYLGLGDDERALELFQKAEKVNSECGAAHNYQIVLANIGNVYLHRREYLTAIAYYQRALALAREIKDPVSVKKWTRNINLAYARIKLAVDVAHPRIA